MTIHKLIVPAAVCAGALLWAAVAPTKPTVVACVDLERVYRSLDQLKAAESTAESLRTQLQSRVNAVTAEVEAMKQELESFQPGSAAHNDAMNKAILKAGDLSAMQAFAELKMESERANTVRDAYLKVRESCATLAKAQGIDLVFIDDTIPPVTPANLEGTMQQINGRRMLYSSATLEITDLLVEQMNKAFRAANPSFVPAAPDAPTPPSPAAGKS